MQKKNPFKFEQYKILIESAEKNSDKRITQNNIYLTINLAFLSYVLSKKDIIFLLVTSFIGITVCIIWFLTSNNYCKRNKVKFDMINEMESKFGYLYKEERKRISVLTSLLFYEKIVSIVFMLIYVIVPIIKLIIK